jgi:hypothetical protein
MRWETHFQDQTLVLTVRSEERKSRVLFLLTICLVLSAAQFFFSPAGGVLIWCTLGFLWASLELLRREFATSVLAVNRDTVSLSREVLGLGRARIFARSDVERLGYLPGVQDAEFNEDPALAIMVRTVVLPLTFAHGMSRTEAEKVFASIKSSGCWIADVIRPVGMPMF